MFTDMTDGWLNEWGTDDTGISFPLKAYPEKRVSCYFTYGHWCAVSCVLSFLLQLMWFSF